MDTLEFMGNRYSVDDEGFLKDPREWNEHFPEGMAPLVGISGTLTATHWDVILSIRKITGETGKCPTVYEICRRHSLRLEDLKRLFPTGYRRGACKLAGLTCREGIVHEAWLPPEKRTTVSTLLSGRTYRVDITGFLVEPSDWDEFYAIFKAQELGMSEPLAGAHWKILNFLRASFEKNGTVPTVYETCEANDIGIEELERLFPMGYHRGAVKIAGLHIR